MNTKLTRSRQIFVAVLVLLAAFMLAGHAQAQPSNETICSSSCSGCRALRRSIIPACCSVNTVLV
jgi:hypothetical protein